MIKRKTDTSPFAETLRDFRAILGTYCIWKNSDMLIPDGNLPDDCTTHNGCRFCDAVRNLPQSICQTKLRCLANDGNILPVLLHNNQSAPFVNICHGGAAELIIGIPFRDNIIAGAIMAGPFRLTDTPHSAYQDEEIEKEYQQLPVLTEGKKQAVMRCCQKLFRQAGLEMFLKNNLGNTEEIGYPALNDLISFLHKQKIPHMSPDEAAKFCCMSLSTFQRLFKKHSRYTFARYINRMKVYASQIKLLDVHKSIGSIALEYGFSSQSHYTTVFKNYFWTTPAQFRKMHVR